MVRRRCQTAFTLVELLVVIAIIAILIARLLPAVLLAREAGRRIHCGNNIKQIALALHNYHEFQSKFPPGQWFRGETDSRKPVDRAFGWGWSAMILPQMEESALYDELDMTLPLASPVNINLVRVPNSDFTCPSATMIPPDGVAIGQESESFSITNPGMALSNYVGNGGDNPTSFYSPVYKSNQNRSGILMQDDPVRIANITDGVSNTLLLGETIHYRGIRSNTKNFRWDPTLYGRANANYGTTDDSYALLRIGNRQPNPPINVTGSLKTSYASFHEGGAQFAVCDGSVRFIIDLVHVKLLKQLSSRKDGEFISDDYWFR